ncbi:amidohydrolase family protein [Paracidobacterium acidisoli]|nr:amidohydrolase family protein [Paracidobacterium acidisoli]MBT9331961.1 amidohydrolase family protein [Paracidobacterium acidisoli]
MPAVSVVLLTITTGAGVFSASAQPSTAGSVITITHVRVIDGTGQPPLEDQDVTIAGSRIRSVRPAAADKPAGQIVDSSGKTLLPGLINAHGHLALVDGTGNSAGYYTEPHVIAELRQYERYGVLTMLSLGLNRDLVYQVRAQQRAGTLDGTTVFSADRGIGVPGGAPALPHQPDQLYQPRTPQEAREAVDAAADRHAEFVKVWVDDAHGTLPKMSPDVYRAVIDEAHKRRIQVAAHVYALADAKQLVADGVDVLAHSVRDSQVDAQLLDAMKRRGTYYLPTLTVDASFFDFADHPELLHTPFFQHAVSADTLAYFSSAAYRSKVADDPSTAQHRHDFAQAAMNLKLAYDAGVKVGFGTDSGAMPSRVPGFAEHRELQLMVDAGLTPLQAISCATRTNAALLGISAHTGTIIPGKQADLLLVDGNPAISISDTEKIVAIWHAGKSVTPVTTSR